MTLEELGIAHKKIGDMLIAGIRFRMKHRQEMSLKFEKLADRCKVYICGPPFTVFNYGTGTKRGLGHGGLFPGDPGR